MKSLFAKSILILAISVCASSIGKAQPTYYQRNVSEQFKKTGTTTNSTATTLDSIVVSNTEGGTIEIKAIAYLQDSGSVYVATKQYRYQKKLGTLTVTIIDSSQSVSSDLSGAGVFLSNSGAGNNLRLSVVGKSSTTLRWSVIPKQYFRRTE